MDIAAMSMSMSQASVGTQVSLALTKMTMDMSEQTGQSMMEMMKSMEISVNPNLGSNIDLSV